MFWNTVKIISKKIKKTSKETVKNVNYVNLVLDASAATEKKSTKSNTRCNSRTNDTN